MDITKKKGQPVKVGLDSLGTRMIARFPEMVPGAGLEPARLAAGDFESLKMAVLVRHCKSNQ